MADVKHPLEKGAGFEPAAVELVLSLFQFAAHPYELPLHKGGSCRTASGAAIKLYREIRIERTFRRIPQRMYKLRAIDPTRLSREEVEKTSRPRV